ncbi:MAG: proton-conducting transporter membrane subunit [Candidatus Aegiribacteria sp.]
MSYLIDALKNPDGYFASTPLSLLCAVFAAMFFVFTIIYSIRHMKGRSGLWRYYIYLLATFLATLGILFTTTFLLLLVLWGFLGLMLYLLIGFGNREGTPESARKSLAIIGGTDVLMLLGIVLVWSIEYGGTGLAGFMRLPFGGMSIELNTTGSVIAYLCLASAAFAKAGAMPFHTWLPDTARDAPVPVTAYLPASLDKLLGIYFLARVTLNVFVMTPAMNTVLMALGSVTIMAAVMMALVQHDLKRLLGYHAVSQVGYMVLGIGTGNPVGIAGALFHMFNNTIYKSSLFLAGGEVERRTGTADLSKLGGLVKAVPMVFVAFLIASLSISGVPPFNGFASKWMLYQGVIGAGTGNLWVIWLIAAMLGSALTLASFMKLIHTVFLGQPSELSQKVIEKKERTGFTTMLPLAVLSLLCIGLGVMAWKIPFSDYFRPEVSGEVYMPGVWESGLATLVLVAGLVIGYLIYLSGTLKKARVVEPFVGGETLEDNPDMRVSGVDFYRTIREMGILRGIYRMAEKKFFDLYEVLKKTAAGFGIIFSFMHNGILSRYFLWFIIGLVVLCIVLI